MWRSILQVSGLRTPHTNSRRVVAIHPASNGAVRKWAAALWTEPLTVISQRVRPGPYSGFSDLIPPAGAARGGRHLHTDSGAPAGCDLQSLPAGSAPERPRAIRLTG